MSRDYVDKATAWDAIAAKNEIIARLRKSLEIIAAIEGPDGETETYRDQQDGRLIAQARIIATTALAELAKGDQS